MATTGMRNRSLCFEKRNVYRDKYDNVYIVRQEALRKMEHERGKGMYQEGKRRGMNSELWAQHHYEDNKAGVKKRGESELSTEAEYV